MPSGFNTVAKCRLTHPTVAAVDRTRHLAYVPSFAVRSIKDSARFMFLFQFLLVVHAVIAAALVGVILVQKSEGGGLGMGGSPAGLMSARGAADFLTRATSILGASFILLSIVLAVLAAQGRSTKIDTSLARGARATAPVLPAAPAGDPNAAPFSAGARSALQNQAAPPADNGSVPLAQ